MDPRELGPRPPFPKQQQRHPGSIFQLTPPADHGETSYSGSSRLSRRVAIITGADSGIGRATAIAFAKEGADIVLSYLPEEEADATDTSKEIENAGRKAIRLPGDIGSAEYAESLVEAAFDQFHRLDIVVNNAAYQMSREEIKEISPEEFEHTFRTNVFGLFYFNPGRVTEAEARRSHTQYNIDSGLRAERKSGAVRCHQSGDRQHHQEPCKAGQQTRRSRECGGSRTSVDSIDPGHHGRRNSMSFR